MEPRRFIQLASVLFSASSVIIFILTVRQYKWHRRSILVAPIVLFTHITVYYIAVFLFSGKTNLCYMWFGYNIAFNAWSAGVTLHAVITVIILSYMILRLYNTINDTTL